MLFTSAVFLFLFLPLVAGSYFASRDAKWRNLVLVMASLVFYCWGETQSAWLIGASILFNFLAAQLLERYRSTRSGLALLMVASAVNLSALSWFKYARFFAESFNSLLAPALHWQPAALPEINLPLGISFFVFHCISYIVDVYRGEAPAQRNLLKMTLYISMFPQLIAGPIVRYRDIAAQLSSRSTSIDRAGEGIERFIVGLGKKLLIANALAGPTDHIFALPLDQLSCALTWLGAVCFTLQIYFDFSGYSDMAIGLALIFGFRLRENFNYPYTATSMREFWQRWHISLSTWFRDYLYIPLGGSRCGPLRTCRNLFIVFLLCGLWHGASLTFVVWGLLHGAFLALERTAFKNVLLNCWCPLRRMYVALVVVTTFVIFRSATLAQAGAFLLVMCGLNKGGIDPLDIHVFLNRELVAILIAALIGSTPLLASALSAKASPERARPLLWSGAQLSFVFATLIFSVAEVAASGYKPFLYFRF